MISIKRNTKTIIPMHKEISKGTLNGILKQSKLTEQEISKLLE